MFLLINDNLPDEPIVGHRFAPAFALNPEVAPGFLLLPNKGLPEAPLDTWDVDGGRYQVVVDEQVLSMSIDGYFFSDDPVSIRPNEYWFDPVIGQLNIYSTTELSTSSPVTINLEYEKNIIEAPGQSFIKFYLPKSGWILTSIDSGGTTFVQGVDGSPGTFTQSGQLITMHQDGSYRAFDPLILSIAVEVLLTKPGIILTVSESRFQSVEYVDFLGASFTPTTDIYRPNNNEFVYDGQVLTLFAPETLLAGVDRSAIANPGSQYLSELEYTA